MKKCYIQYVLHEPIKVHGRKVIFFIKKGEWRDITLVNGQWSATLYYLIFIARSVQYIYKKQMFSTRKELS